MGRCGSCGAVVGAAATWCGQCFAPAGAGLLGDERSVLDPARTESMAQPPPPGVHVPRSRWRGSQVTFGPLGRLVLTGLLLLPLLWFWKLGALFGWTGLAIWGGTVVPWALRDVWRQVRVRSD